MGAILGALARVAEAQGNASLYNQDLQRQLSDPLRLAKIQEANLQLQEMRKQMGREDQPQFKGFVTLPDGSIKGAFIDPKDPAGKLTFQDIAKVDPNIIQRQADSIIAALPADKQTVAKSLWGAYAARGSYDKGLAALDSLARQKTSITTKNLMGPDGVQHTYSIDPDTGEKLQDLGITGSAKTTSLVDDYNRAVASGDKVKAKSLAAQIRSEYDLTHPYAATEAGMREEQASLMRMTKADAAAKPYTQIVTAADKGLQAASEQTGPGDVGFLMAFIDATRPSVFRFSPTEIQLIKNARAMGGANLTAQILRAKAGLLFTPTQREQMVAALMKAKEQARNMATETYRRYKVDPPSFVSGDGSAAPPPGAAIVP